MVIVDLLQLKSVDTQVVKLKSMMTVKFKSFDDAPNDLSQAFEAFLGRNQVVLSIMDPALSCARSWVSRSGETDALDAKERCCQLFRHCASP